MKVLSVIFAISLVFVLAGCTRAGDDPEAERIILEARTGHGAGAALTEAEKKQLIKNQLAIELQSTIETFDAVSEANVTIDTLDEAEKNVKVLVATKQNMPLTDEEISSIRQVIKNSLDGQVTVTVETKKERDPLP